MTKVNIAIIIAIEIIFSMIRVSSIATVTMQVISKVVCVVSLIFKTVSKVIHDLAYRSHGNSMFLN